MAFVGEELELVADVAVGEGAVELVGLGDGDGGVGGAVEDEDGRGGSGEAGLEARGEATGELDDGFEARGTGGEGYGEVAAERDAEDCDAVGVDGGVCGGVDDGVFEGGEPGGEVVAVEDELGRGAGGAGALEVVRAKRAVPKPERTGARRSSQKPVLPPEPWMRMRAGWRVRPCWAGRCSSMRMGLPPLA